MWVVFDAGMLSILIHPSATIPNDPATSKPLERAKDRIQFLVDTLEEEGATIIIPTPALAEFLYVVDDAGASYLRVLNTYAVFDIQPFDEKAAIECAESQRIAMKGGDKKSGATGSYQKSKVDRQVISVAKAWGADAIYTTDDDVVRMAKAIGGLLPVPVWQLRLPPDNAGGTTRVRRNSELDSAELGDLFDEAGESATAASQPSVSEPLSAQSPDDVTATTPEPAPARPSDRPDAPGPQQPDSSRPAAPPPQSKE
jgi:predicted nucleic acid-binding protein